MSRPTADTRLIAPDGCTTFLASAVEAALADLPPGAVLGVACPDLDTRADLAEWCLRGGRRIRNPFAHHLDDLLIEDRAA